MMKIIKSLSPFALAAATAILLSACDTPEDSCATSDECDVNRATRGFLCVADDCVECAASEDCAADPYYGEGATCINGMCTPACPNTMAGCPCADGECGAGLVCDQTTETCREPYTCDDITCLDHQLCVEGDEGAAPDAGADTQGIDAFCDEACEDYWYWDYTGEICEPRLNCEADAPNSILEDCDAEMRQCMETDLSASCEDCVEGYVEESGECREAHTCEDLGCASANRDCQEAAGNADAECLDCLEGHMEVHEECYPMTCEMGEPGSIQYDCTQQHRLCDDSGATAQCGDCLAWYLEEAGECRHVVECADLDCSLAYRSCVSATVDADAYCGDCLAGYSEMFGDCEQMSGAVCTGGGSLDISGECDAENRECVTPECTTGPCEDSYCGDCVEDHVEVPATGLCEPYVECPEDPLDPTSPCAGVHRFCDGDPTAHCTDCLYGLGGIDYLEDGSTGLCRPAITCADITCGTAQECQEHTATTDAYCRPDCDADEIWSVWGCVGCPDCDGEGEVGVWPEATSDGRCICQTEDGYFYNVAGDIGAYPCDDDGDGWVRESARVALDSEDDKILANARCDLRTIDRFVLQNRLVNRFDPATDCVDLSTCAEWKEILLEEPLSLYESDRNDDQGLLELDTVKAPYYGGRQPLAEELNRLTKYCVDGADYNDNMVADIEEWDYRELPSGFPVQLEPFNWFSYFAELHRGWYMPPLTSGGYGSYHIREKSRRDVALAGDRVPVKHYNSSSDAPGGTSELAFYETCALWRDPDFADDGNPTIGRDFARWGPETDTYGWALEWDPGMTQIYLNLGAVWDSVSYGWDGMNYHSQYKCVEVVDDGNPDLDDEENPHLMTIGQLGDENFQFNSCAVNSSGASSPPLTGTDDVNPYDPDVVCAVEDAAVDSVGWVARLYESYTDNENYPGGCVNQLTASNGRCGTCGLGIWENGSGVNLGPASGTWTDGAFDEMFYCEDVDLSPIGDTSDWDCDDEAPTTAFLFVDSTWGSDSSYYGSRNRPYATIQAAIDRAMELNYGPDCYSNDCVQAIIVTANVYFGPVELEPGISLLGGFTTLVDDDNDLYWVRTNDTDRTILATTTVQTDPKRLVGIEAVDIPFDEPTLVDRFDIDIDATSETGLSLYGVYANNAPGLYVRDTIIDVDNATAGADGLQAPAATSDGNNGRPDGQTVYNNCLVDPTFATSGAGGGWDGCINLNGESTGGGAYIGGTANCTAISGCTSPVWPEWNEECTPYTSGSDGAAGSDGSDATALTTTLDAEGWWNTTGQTDGESGGTGWGGAGGAGYTTSGTTCATIHRGGSGGAGGCGGLAGEAGEMGGSAFGVFAITSDGMSIEDCAITTGDGGAGGDGGPGGLGGAGGTGAYPTGQPTMPTGGNGGDGGDGGDGAGGNGGASCGIMIDDATSITTLGTVSNASGSHGAGGEGAANESAEPDNDGYGGGSWSGTFHCDPTL